MSVAWLLSSVLQRLGSTEVDVPRHLCSRFWGRKTFGGVNCVDCDTISAAHAQFADELAERTRNFLAQ